MNDFFLIYLILPATLRPGVYSASDNMSTRSRKMFLESRARPVSRVGNLTVICDPIF
jgi:hypothetical protein